MSTGPDNHAIILFSGGPDSTAAALWAQRRGLKPTLLFMQFKGTSQVGELRSALEVADLLGMAIELMDFRSPMASYPDEYHALMHAESKEEKINARRLPFGAGMILSAAANFAASRRVHELVWGATRDDSFEGKFEYTQEFADTLATLVARSIGESFSIHLPFGAAHKYQTMDVFRDHPELFGRTWSCKAGGSEQCGSCAACIARRVSAQLARINDPTGYRNKSVRLPLTREQMENPSSIAPEILSAIAFSNGDGECKMC